LGIKIWEIYIWEIYLYKDEYCALSFMDFSCRIEYLHRIFSIFSYAYVRALSGVCLSVLPRYYFQWGWPILLVYGSIDSLWPKDPNDGRIFLGPVLAPRGRAWSPFSLIKTAHGKIWTMKKHSKSSRKR
jgi:hypothetical protein